VYAITKELAGKLKAFSTQVENKEGFLLIQTDDINRRWMEHFSEVLNQAPPTTSLNFPEETLFDLGIYSGPLLLSEVKEALMTLSLTLNRIKSKVEKVLRDEQHGFRQTDRVLT